ncbi:molybdenum cofactor biosynthesis protein MoaE [methanotrophic endosymbiont of Bathymodiolus puteoserpentis (Logatchev)]|jgi:molybdopterin synthase catalytic subunit|uniref:molybdenum cofactor biosynthesis protein MoaE n=1 Tax=methanotrophic endosymbiont of Bathymodiolus puteoserpentis (Logatchev) TaxID=343235 RepID=UPI0013C8B92C|nr:molybdenum cofactor biosynthesis protein MoaE [methanotrophic endosymbiont of Bathymodiolus puteoserpentis (Logatchev)]SHE22779.1 Molybdenum cofactor biosynthesis protein MoaE [methanotrophic endosymbiont of Bathymodiolus puteoserpentis (Logatchev)]
MIKIISEEFDPFAEVQAYQKQQQALSGKYGATNIFIGTMRDFNEGERVKGMTLEHYPGMTEKQLLAVVQEAERQWSILDVLVIHRVGDVFPDDVLVLVVVWSGHRGGAFDASRFIMETLKSKVPFWKKEILADDQSRWVAKNTDGYL